MFGRLVPGDYYIWRGFCTYYSSSGFKLLFFCVTVVGFFVSGLTLGFSFNLPRLRSLTVILLRLAAALLCAVVAAHVQQAPALREREFVVRHDPVQYYIPSRPSAAIDTPLDQPRPRDSVELSGRLRPEIHLGDYDCLAIANFGQ